MMKHFPLLLVLGAGLWIGAVSGVWVAYRLVERILP